jgi:hypothetical protein
MSKKSDLIEAFIKNHQDKEAVFYTGTCEHYLKVGTKNGTTCYCFKDAHLDHGNIHGHKQIEGCEIVYDTKRVPTVLGCEHVA